MTFYSLVTLGALPWLWPFTPGPTPNAAPLLFSWAALGLFVLIVMAAGNGSSSVRQAVPAAWLAASLASAVIALGQWFGAAPDVSWLSAAGVGEAYANLRQRNQFASLTSLGLLALLWFAGRRPSALWYAAGALLAAANAASASRTGLLQWLLIAAVCAWWAKAITLQVRLCLAALAAYAVAALALPQLLWQIRGVYPPNVFERVAADLGCSSRKVLWSNVAELISRRPWAGWGPGELDYAHYATLYSGPRFCDILDNAHNLPLHLAVEMGVPLALLVCVGVGAWVWRSRPLAERDPLRQLAWGALGVIGVHSLLEYPLWYGPFQAAVAFSVWLLMPQRHWGPNGRRALAGLACAGLLAIVMASEEYGRVSQAYKPEAERRAGMRFDPVATVGPVLVFSSQVRFAELSITPLSRASAGRVHELAGQMLHYSPEPAVIEKVIESALMLGRMEEAVWHAARYRAAFPDRYGTWAASAGAVANLAAP